MPAELFLYGDFGAGWWSEGIEASDVVEFLSDVSSSDGLDVRINTYGGDVSTGLTIMNLLLSFASKQKLLNPDYSFRTIVDGFCYSAGTLPLLASDVRIANPGVKIMIHNPISFVMGDANMLEKEAETLRKTKTTIANLYASATGKEQSTFLSLMDEETYFTGEEARQIGLVTDVRSISSFMHKSNPYESSLPLLNSISRFGTGAYQKSFALAKKIKDSGSINCLNRLKAELDFVTLLSQ